MSWLCAEVRDEPTLELLLRSLRDQTVQARERGRFDASARVYVTPYKASHRVYFNFAAQAMLPALQGLAHAPCEAPQDHEMREPLCA
jgi:hypothetical protein